MEPPRLPEDDALTCLVCMNVLCDPVTLQPCGHSFCAHCVDAQLDAGHADCALCQHGIEGTLLDFSLKAAVEERHAAALASRRARLQLPERTIFSRTPRVHAIGFLHLVTNVWPWMRGWTMECWSMAARLYRVIRSANDAAVQRASDAHAYPRSFECPVCCDLLVDPVILSPCGHSCCAHCHDHWLDHKAAYSFSSVLGVVSGNLSSHPVKCMICSKAIDSATLSASFRRAIGAVCPEASARRHAESGGPRRRYARSHLQPGTFSASSAKLGWCLLVRFMSPALLLWICAQYATGGRLGLALAWWLLDALPYGLSVWATGGVLWLLQTFYLQLQHRYPHIAWPLRANRAWSRHLLSDDDDMMRHTLVFLLLGGTSMAGGSNLLRERGEAAWMDTAYISRVLQWDDGCAYGAVEPLGRRDSVDRMPFRALWTWIRSFVVHSKPHLRPHIGPGFAFGRQIASLSPEFQVLLVPLAVEGTHPANWQRGCSSYAYAIKQAKQAARYGRLAGALFSSEGGSVEDAQSAAKYAQQLRDLVEALRSDLALPELPLLLVEPGSFGVRGQEHIVQAVRDAAEGTELCVTVASEGLHHAGDHVHLDSTSQRLLAWRCAAEWRLLQTRIEDESWTPERAMEPPSTEEMAALRDVFEPWFTTCYNSGSSAVPGSYATHAAGLAGPRDYLLTDEMEVLSTFQPDPRMKSRLVGHSMLRFIFREWSEQLRASAGTLLQYKNSLDELLKCQLHQVEACHVIAITVFHGLLSYFVMLYKPLGHMAKGETFLSFLLQESKPKFSGHVQLLMCLIEYVAYQTSIRTFNNTLRCAALKAFSKRLYFASDLLLGEGLVGCDVAIRDLQSRPELNGQVGEVLSRDANTGRYGVRLKAKPESAPLAMRPINLKPVGSAHHSDLGEASGVIISALRMAQMTSYKTRVGGLPFL